MREVKIGERKTQDPMCRGNRKEGRVFNQEELENDQEVEKNLENFNL